LDSLPFPDRELLDVEYHLKIAEANVAPKKFTSIISSRGCTHRCRFCACHKIARGCWRDRSVENIIEELHHLASKGYKQFMFVDDSFTINSKKVIEFCQTIKKEKMDIQWFFEGRVDSCSYDMLRETVRAGSRIVFFGIESANQRILDYYNKRITPEQTKHAVETAKKAGVDVICGSFMVGAPSETKAEIENTLKFAQQLPLDIPQFNILLVFPGTDIWSELKAKGILDEDKYWETGALISDLSADALPFEVIDRLIREYYVGFFLRTRYLVTQTVKLLKSSYRSNVVIDNLRRADAISDTLSRVL
jgi:anaerobic magnesium-protoporphyrin IX monomethyl ester cyclase